MSSEKTLYERVGGEQGIEVLVERFYTNVLGNHKLRKFFEGVSLERLKNMQKEFFTIALDGPSKYSDMDLVSAHHGLNIEARHFKEFVDTLFETLSELELKEEERYQIISTINTYVGDIVVDAESLTD